MCQNWIGMGTDDILLTPVPLTILLFEPIPQTIPVSTPADFLCGKSLSVKYMAVLVFSATLYG